MFDLNQITRDSGREGPTHDPYGYKEYHFVRGGKEWMLHYGSLIIYLKIDGEQVAEGSKAVSLVENAIDSSLEEYEDWCYDRDFKCKCGSTDLEAKDGHPGETFYVCLKCGTTVSSHVDMSAII